MYEINGIRVVKTHPNSNEFLIVRDSSVAIVDLTNANWHEFINPYIDNTISTFYLNESWKNTDKGSYYYQIVQVDMSGQIIDTIYSAKENENISSYSISPDNEKILIRSFDYFAWRQNRLLTLLENTNIDSSKFIINYSIINIAKKTKEKEIEIKSLFELSHLIENSWSPDSKNILISYKTVNNSQNEEKIAILNTDKMNYKDICIGKNAIWSMKNPDDIYYIQAKEIWKYKISTNTSKLIIKLKTSETFKNLRFTPDGKYLYFNFWKDRICNKIFGDIVCYPYNAYGKVVDLEGKTYKSVKGHYNVETWKE